MTDKIFLAGLATAAFAGTSLVYVAPSRADAVGAIGGNVTIGSSLIKGGGIQSTGIVISPTESVSAAGTVFSVLPNATQALGGSVGVASNGLIGRGESFSDIVISPAGATVTAGAYGATSGNGISGAGSGAGSVQLGNFSAGVAQSNFAAVGSDINN